MSLFGPLQVLLLPDTAAANIDEVGQALIAWRYRLSHEEVRLLECVARGLTNDEITELLHLAEVNTVKNRIQRLFRKLGARNRVQAAVIAGQFGLVAAEVPEPRAE